MRNLILLSLMIASIAVAETKPSPSATVPPPEIKAEAVKPASADAKIDLAAALCEKDKKKCVYKLKEVRATLKDSKENRVLIKKIDALIKKLN